MQRYSILVLLLIITIMLSACGIGGDPATQTGMSGAESSDGVVRIGFAAQGFERATYEPLMQAFHEQNPNIEVQFVSLDEVLAFGSSSFSMNEAMRTLVSIADTAVPFFVSPRDIDAGYLYDLQPLMDADPNFDPNDFYPRTLQSYQRNGGTYLLPRATNIQLLAYNKELWQASGLPEPDLNMSWTDLTAAAEQLARKQGDNVEVYGLVEGNGTLALLAEVVAAGGELFSKPPAEVRLDAPAIVNALTRIAALSESGTLYLPTDESGVRNFDSSGFQQLILDQRVAIWWSGMLETSPDSAQPAFETGVIPFPQVDFPFLDNTEGYIMSSGTQHPQEAWRWLEFLSRQELDTEMVRMNGIGKLPARKSLAEKSGFWEELDAETAAAIRAAVERPVGALPAHLFDNPSVFEPLDEALTAVVTRQKTPEQALADAQVKLQEQVAIVQQTPEPTPDPNPIVVQLPEVAVAPEGATTITFLAMGGPGGKMRDLARTFQEQNPAIFVAIKEPDFQRGNDFLESASTMDCFNWYAVPDTTMLTATLDMQPLIDADASFPLDDYPASLLSPFRRGSGLHGIPYGVNFRSLTYNKTAFEATGVESPHADWSMDDFLLAAQQLTQGEGSTKQYGYASTSATSDDLFFFLNRFGARISQGSTDNPDLTFTDPAVLQTITFYIDLLRNYSPHKELTGYRNDGSWDSTPYQLTEEGRVGMWFEFGRGQIFSYGTEQNQDFTRGMAPPPLHSGVISAEDFYMSGLYISASTSHPEECWAWIKYLSNDVSNLQDGLPARTSKVESPEFTADAEEGAIEVYRAYLEAMERSPITNEPDPRPTFDTFWFFQAVDRALQGGNLEEELTAAQEKTQQYLECMQAEGSDGATCATSVDSEYKGYQSSIDEGQPEESE